MIRLVLVVLLASAVALAQPAAAVFAQVDEIVTGLSDITGWQVRKKIPSQILSKTTFRHYLETRVKGSSNEKDIHVEELTLKLFGLIPQDFNLANETVDLMSEQAAAFYDFNRKRLFILDSTPEGPERRMALVHELAHALADQHHPLGKFQRQGSPDDDAATAREAVMEGQATWLSWAYESRRAGGKAEVPPAVLDQITKTTAEDSAEFPVLSAAPLYLRESLVFPYSEGTKFQDAEFHRLGQPSFDELFTRPPRSTQQIMHPDAYESDKRPIEPDFPVFPAIAGKNARLFRMLAEGSIGEFDLSILLRQYVGETEATPAAGHWRGGSFRIYEHRHEKYPLLAHVSEWDSPEAARDFFALYQRVLKGKWKQMQIGEQSAEAISGSGDSGRFEVRVAGTRVQSIEGLR